MSTTQIIRTQGEQLIYLFNPHAVGCPVDWRWQRAQWRVSSRSRFRERNDDDWVRQAVKHLRSRHRGTTDINHDIVEAHKLLTTDYWKRAELEARILANQPINEMTPAMRVSEHVISAFENLFFDVRRRLFAQDWVTCSLFRGKCFEQFEPLDVRSPGKALVSSTGRQLSTPWSTVQIMMTSRKSACQRTGVNVLDCQRNSSYCCSLERFPIRVSKH